MRKLSLLVCSIMLVSLAACGGKKDDIPDLPAGAGSGGGGDAAPPTTASITGKISFEGEVPKLKKIDTSSDQECKKEIFEEGVKVKDGGLANVIIYVSGGDLAGKTYAPPTTPVEINQQDCHYIPHAFVLMVNQELSIRNSDNTLHNIHAATDPSIGNAAFNTGQPVPGVLKHVFDHKEILLPIKCDVHKWMGAFIAVVDNPFATVSAEGGAFELKLPAGKFEITAIHEKYGMQKMMVEVKDGDHTPMNFKFKASDAKSGN